MITNFNKFNEEAYIDKEGNLKDFTENLIFYEGDVAFVYKKHEKHSKTEYRVYGIFTTEAGARDMEEGRLYYEKLPGYISYNITTGNIEPRSKSIVHNVCDFFGDDDLYNLDNLCNNVITEIFG